jgi:acetyltransferase-like isoleucine patch superfamily enzyme
VLHEDIDIRRLFKKLLYFVYLTLLSLNSPRLTGLRRVVLRALLDQPLEKLYVEEHVRIDCYEQLRIGINVSLNHHCVLSCPGGLDIGNDVSIGHGTSILTTEHSFDDSNLPIKNQPIQYKPVKIGSNIWIGARVIILAGVTISDGTIIGAGSVVTKSITEPDTIVAGVPARFIKKRLIRP